jgi:hypothetical protein
VTHFAFCPLRELFVTIVSNREDATLLGR